MSGYERIDKTTIKSQYGTLSLPIGELSDYLEFMALNLKAVEFYYSDYEKINKSNPESTPNYNLGKFIEGTFAPNCDFSKLYLIYDKKKFDLEKIVFSIRPHKEKSDVNFIGFPRFHHDENLSIHIDIFLQNILFESLFDRVQTKKVSALKIKCQTQLYGHDIQREMGDLPKKLYLPHYHNTHSFHLHHENKEEEFYKDHPLHVRSIILLDEEGFSHELKTGNYDWKKCDVVKNDKNNNFLFPEEHDYDAATVKVDRNEAAKADRDETARNPVNIEKILNKFLVVLIIWCVVSIVLIVLK